MENVEFCISAAYVKRLACRAISASDDFLVLCSDSKHHVAAQQTLYEQLAHEHRQQQQQWQQQPIIMDEDEEQTETGVITDVIGDDVISKQPLPSVEEIRKFSVTIKSPLIRDRTGHCSRADNESVGQMGHFFDGSHGSWVTSCLPTTYQAQMNSARRNRK